MKRGKKPAKLKPNSHRESKCESDKELLAYFKFEFGCVRITLR